MNGGIKGSGGRGWRVSPDWVKDFRFGDVGGAPGNAQEASGRVTNGIAAVVNPAFGTVGAANAVLNFEEVAHRYRD